MSAPKVDVIAWIDIATIGLCCYSPNSPAAHKGADVKKAVAELIKALKIAVRQNQHDMLMTGEELRICEAALSRIGGDV